MSFRVFCLLGWSLFEHDACIYAVLYLFIVTGSLFNSAMGEGIYESSRTMDGSLENIDEVLMTQTSQNNGSGHGTLVNPIDKLYSMQSSYFNAE